MIKIFLVEDEIVIREGIHRMVPWLEYGFELSGEASDGEMALPLILERKPDVLITDVKMPFMDGLTLSRLVKKELPDTKIIIISGYDDFKYAQQAISLGVERYLLKPISRNSFIEVLEEIRAKFEHENAQKLYYEKFKNELQEYEQHSRRDFFETLVSGHISLSDIYKAAEKLQIDIYGQSYNIVLFSMYAIEKNRILSDSYSQDMADLQNRLEELLHKRKDCLLFRNQIFSYAVLVKGEKEQIEEQTTDCVRELKELFSSGGEHMEWFICTGRAVERISSLPECYQAAMRIFNYRYIDRSSPAVHGERDEEYGRNTDEVNLKNIDAGTVNPETIMNFLSNALLEEVEDFVGNYLGMIGEEALRSRLFRQYILLNIHFSTAAFIQRLGYQKEELDDCLPVVSSDTVGSPEEAARLVKKILSKGIRLREDSTKSRYKSMLETAITFIQNNYMDEMLSLNKVACAANVSANHFSALFSQEMNKTFIEYLTELRMKKAKELLRCTDKRSGEIAMEVGYKDSHYFSFLFKKTQGCTPSDYRNKKGGQREVVKGRDS